MAIVSGGGAITFQLLSRVSPKQASSWISCAGWRLTILLTSIFQWLALCALKLVDCVSKFNCRWRGDKPFEQARVNGSSGLPTRLLVGGRQLFQNVSDCSLMSYKAAREFMSIESKSANREQGWLKVIRVELNCGYWANTEESETPVANNLLLETLWTKCRLISVWVANHLKFRLEGPDDCRRLKVSFDTIW